MKEAFNTPAGKRKQRSPLLYFLGFVFCLFIGILIFAYMVTKKAHPVYTDQQGNPTNAASTGNK
jgi:hypothetical protein